MYRSYVAWCLLVIAFQLAAYTPIQSSRSPDVIQACAPVKWSILICTLDERRECFNTLYNKLYAQIKKLGLQDGIEILWFCDNRQYTIGYKRNALLSAAQGAYLNFLDDDDDVHFNYIGMIYECIQKNPDVVELRGIITTNGKDPREFRHSVKYSSWFEKNRIYYRPPNHLNTIKSDIAKRFRFPDDKKHGMHGEDADWSMQIVRSGLLKKEEGVNEPYYFYLYET
jgi:hypothetical protein